MIEVKPLFQLKASVDPPQVIEGPLGKRLFIPVSRSDCTHASGTP